MTDDKPEDDKHRAYPPPAPMAAPPRTGGPDGLTEQLVRAAMSKEPVEIPPIEYASAEDFARCIKPREALAALDLPLPLAIKQLHREMDVRRVVAVAEHAIWKEHGQVSQGHYVVVPRWVWRFELRETDDFWDTRYLLVTLPVEGWAAANYERWMKLFDVRFWPEGLIESPLSAHAHKADSTRADLPFPPREEVERFSRAILAGWPSTTLDEAHKKAVTWFPDNAVSRDKFRAIFSAIRGPKKRGRQPKTDN